MCPTKDCIFYEGHGGEHFISQDGKDQSDEIRLRILRDKVAELKAKLVEKDAIIDQRNAMCSREFQRAEAAEAEVRRLTLEADRSEALMEAQDKAIEAGLAWQKEARAALKRYGRHSEGCSQMMRHGHVCGCGLDAALEHREFMAGKRKADEGEE